MSQTNAHKVAQRDANGLTITYEYVKQTKATQPKYLGVHFYKYYTVSRKKRGSTFDIITLEKHARLF